MIPSLLLGLALAADGPRDVMPDRAWDFQHLHLDVRIDPAEGRVEGTVRHEIAPLSVPHRWVRLHQIDLDIERVRVDDIEVADFRVRDGLLEIPVEPGTSHTLEIDYAAAPETGMHFRAPRGVDTYLEAWTQGEDEDHRYWFPGWDHPNDRFTYSARLTVPEGMLAVSNGVSIPSSESSPVEPGWTTWSYTLDHEIVNYLVAVAVGNYEVYKEEGVVPLEYVVPPGTPRDVAVRSLGYAREQLAFYNDLLGVDYPYPVYRQVAVQRFLYGAMENTTTTIIGDGFLLRRDDAPTNSTESVVAHELVHHWFGDLLTCYGWRELWLNEGFATYYAARWMESQHGRDAAAIDAARRFDAALYAERPMAARGWSKVDDSPNASVYVRGATVLHMLEVLLGRPTFDKAIAEYVRRNVDRLVETADLRRAFEDVSGQQLGWLFDQWVHGATFPKLKTSWRWADGTLEVAIKRAGDKPSSFHAPVEIDVGTPTGVQRHSAWITDEHTTLSVSMEEAPTFVAVDPRGGVLAHWQHDQEHGQWVAQLRDAKEPRSRVHAMNALAEAKKSSPEGVAVLREILTNSSLHDRYRGVAASTLGAMKSDEAAEVLVSCLSRDEHLLRTACARALDQFEQAAVAPALRAATTDATPEVAGAALRSLASVDAPTALRIARKTIRGTWSTETTRLFEAAVRVIDAHGEGSDVDRLITLIGPSYGDGVRQTAAYAAGRLIDELEGPALERARKRATDQLLPALHDPNLRIRQGATWALQPLGERDRAIAALLAVAAETTVSDLEEGAREAIESLRKRTDDKADTAEKPDDTETLDSLMERLEGAEKRLDELEKWR